MLSSTMISITTEPIGLYPLANIVTCPKVVLNFFLMGRGGRSVAKKKKKCPIPPKWQSSVNFVLFLARKA